MKKITALLLALAMVFSCFVFTFADGYTDMEGHWSKSSVDRWSEFGVFEGYTDGTYKPENIMNRAEAAATFAKLLNLTTKGDISGFTDLTENWYMDDFALCVGSGILEGYSPTEMAPKAPVTREMFFTMFARALGFAPVATANKPISDIDQASDWAAGYIKALVNAGIVEGMGSDTGVVDAAPALNINRASVAALLDQGIGTYAGEDNTVVPFDKEGIVLVVADNVTITGAPAGTLVITKTAEGAKVNGKSVSATTAYEVPKEVVATHTHTYDDQWSSDVIYHWHDATCGHDRVSDRAKHTWNSTYTECTVCGYERGAEKLAFEVASGTDKVTLNVYEDYSFVIAVPAAKTVSAASASASISMTNVASLDITGTKSAGFGPIETGLTNTADLTGELGNAWTMGKADTTLNVTIGDKAVTYVIQGSANKNPATDTITEAAYIYGAPTDVEKARAAWQALTEHVGTDENTDGNSQVWISDNSYAQLGLYKLQFEDGEADLILFDEPDWTFGSLNDEVRDKIVMSEEAESKVEAYIGASSTLAVSDSVAYLKAHCKVTVQGIAADAAVMGTLPALQAASNTKDMIVALVKAVNDAMGAVAGKTLTVTVSFTPADPA